MRQSTSLQVRFRTLLLATVPAAALGATAGATPAAAHAAQLGAPAPTTPAAPATPPSTPPSAPTTTTAVLALPAGSLAASLETLARQTGEQLAYAPGDVAGRRAPAVSGPLTAEAALARLLAGSDLVATRAGPRLLVLRPRDPADPVPARTDAAPSPPSSSPAGAPRPFGAEAGDPRPAASPAGGAPEALAARPIPPRPPATVAEVLVTGSHIRGAAMSASPLLVLDRDALDRLGRPTLAEALNSLPQVFGGQATEGTVATSADTTGGNNTYATGVNLRGLGANATLVLVNGRRSGGSGSNGDFVDVSSLPSIAVSRVEILLDGASATYGSDAVGGVVNVILRRDFQGGEIRLGGGTARGDSPREFEVGVALGHTWRTGGVLFAYEGYQRDALRTADRPFVASADLRRFGGTDRRSANAFPGNIVAVDPATGVSGPYFGIPPGQDGTGLRPQDFRPGELNRASRQTGFDLLPGQRRQGGYLAVHQALGEAIELSGDLRYGFRAARTHIAAPTANLTVGRNNPFFVSPNGAASHQIQYSFVGELPNPITRATAETISASLGGKVRLPAAWAADAYVAFAQEIDEARPRGFINTLILAEALGNSPDRPETAYNPLRDGYFNPYTGVAANPQAVLSAISSGFTQSRSRSRVRSANLQADGPLFRLPGGDLKLAVGLNARRETFLRGGASYTSTAAPVISVGVQGRRAVEAAFAEVRAPLFGEDNARPGLARLELSGAVRAERFSDFGRTLDPKVGLAWAPRSDLTLRATYGQSFRAPGLTQLLNEQSVTAVGFTVNGVLRQTLAYQGGNPDLQPETARTWTAGLDYRPSGSPGTRLSLTWFDTDFRDRIGRPVTENLAGVFTDPRLAPFVRPISPATNPADLALVNAALALPIARASALLVPPTNYVAVVELRQVNTGQLRIRGLDLQASHTVPALGGRLTFSADATRLFAYDQRLTAVAPPIDLAGVATYPAKTRGRLAADFRRERLSAGVAVNYVGPFRDLTGARVEDHATVDLQLRLRAPDGPFSGAAVGLVVRNAFDRDPPFYDNPFGFPFDPANADILGRTVKLQLTRSW